MTYKDKASYDSTPPCRIKSTLEKRAVHCNFFLGIFLSEFRFTVFQVVHLGSGVLDRLLQCLINKCFSQTFERLFSKKKREREDPDVEV